MTWANKGFVQSIPSMSVILRNEGERNQVIFSFQTDVWQQTVPQ